MRASRLTAALVFASLSAAAAGAAETKTLLLLAQKRDHPPGCHEYLAGARVLEDCLRDVPELRTRIVMADEPWPDGPELLAAADGVVLYLGEGGRFMQQRPERWQAFRALAARGGAICGLHWGIGAKDDKYVAGHLEMMGGMHGGSDRKYTVTAAEVHVADRDHPAARGVAGLRLDDEYYYRLKFAQQGRVVPLLKADLDGQAETIAWAFERPDGGRSFGFGGMHYHKNWRDPSCRRLAAQGVLWAMKLPIPAGGLPCKLPDEDPEFPVAICFVPEMQRVVEADNWPRAEDDALAAHTAAARADWQKRRPWIEMQVSPATVRALSRWAKPQMAGYERVPDLQDLELRPIAADAKRGQVCFEATADTLPSHSPIVQRWLKLYLVYEPQSKTIVRATVTIRGEAQE
jgi:hypothetical protein